MSTTQAPPDDLAPLLRRILREELGLTPGLPAPKWRGGQFVVLFPDEAEQFRGGGGEA